MARAWVREAIAINVDREMTAATAFAPAILPCGTMYRARHEQYLVAWVVPFAASKDELAEIRDGVLSGLSGSEGSAVFYAEEMAVRYAFRTIPHIAEPTP